MRRYLKNGFANGSPDENLQPAFEILSDDPVATADPAQATAVLQGRLRQRFLYFVAFKLDPSQLPNEYRQGFANLRDSIPCTRMPSPAPDNQMVREFLEQLPSVADRRSAGEYPLYSSYDTRHLFQGGQTLQPGGPGADTTFPAPWFGSRDGRVPDTGAVIYDHPSLWTRGAPTATLAQQYNILQEANGELLLDLRGLAWINAGTVLGAGGKTVRIKGVGALIVDDGAQLKIEGPVRKHDANSLCVFVARGGRIEINTDQPVEASLVALDDGGHGRVVARKPLDLHGALVVDRLGTGDWADVTHKIRYDPALRRADDLYQITFDRGITFQRYTAGDL